ncbi:hypothetical protein BD779DRAFT_1479393 [Infundibulicybe gibba]|nr:hypothetical protein BD779DRAFT_1479393 [Infundibulicybe gibba]
MDTDAATGDHRYSNYPTVGDDGGLASRGIRSKIVTFSQNHVLLIFFPPFPTSVTSISLLDSRDLHTLVAAFPDLVEINEIDDHLGDRSPPLRLRTQVLIRSHFNQRRTLFLCWWHLRLSNAGASTSWTLYVAYVAGRMGRVVVPSDLAVRCAQPATAGSTSTDFSITLSLTRTALEENAARGQTKTVGDDRSAYILRPTTASIDHSGWRNSINPANKQCPLLQLAPVHQDVEKKLRPMGHHQDRKNRGNIVKRPGKRLECCCLVGEDGRYELEHWMVTWCILVLEATENFRWNGDLSVYEPESAENGGRVHYHEINSTKFLWLVSYQLGNAVQQGFLTAHSRAILHADPFIKLALYPWYGQPTED